MENAQKTTNNDDTQTSPNNKLVKTATFLANAKLGEHVLKNNTLDPITNYIQQITVDVSNNTNPIIAIWAT